MEPFPAKTRIQILLGHYGSGKTSLAVSLARALRRMGKRVTVADLDIVNPYFRSADSRGLLADEGIGLIASQYAGSTLDIPALPAALYATLAEGDGCTVFDVGGDDRGAVAMGRFAKELRAQGGYLAAFVVNFYRPLTRTAEAALAVLREVERACGLRCTALINNSNLGAETAAQDVLSTAADMARLEALSGLPLYLTGVRPGLYPALLGRVERPFAVEPLGYMDR